MERKMNIVEFNQMMQSKQDDTELIQVLRQMTEQARPEHIDFKKGDGGDVPVGGEFGWTGWAL